MARCKKAECGVSAPLDRSGLSGWYLRHIAQIVYYRANSHFLLYILIYNIQSEVFPLSYKKRMSQYLRTTSAQIFDRKLPELQAAAAVLRARPAKGWIHGLRSALGMSATVLARRLGVSHPTVLSYERAELLGRIQIDTLRRVADALDSELIVALVPRKSISEILRARAREIAEQEMSATVQSMRLEDQEVNVADTKAQFDLMVENLVREPKKLWR